MYRFMFSSLSPFPPIIMAGGGGDAHPKTQAGVRLGLRPHSPCRARAGYLRKGIRYGKPGIPPYMTTIPKKGKIPPFRKTVHFPFQDGRWPVVGGALGCAERNMSWCVR